MMLKDLIVLLCTLIIPLAGFTQNARISLRIEGIKNNAGEIGVLLFNQEKGFPGEQAFSLKQLLLPAQKGSMRVEFSDLLYGTYAIAVIHDENNNQKIDLGLFGIPKEGYGFSNNARKLFRAPRFREAAFVLNKPDLELSIKLMY